MNPKVTHTWTEVRFPLPAERQDDLVARLAPLGFAGFLQEEDLLTGYIEHRCWDSALKKRVRSVLQELEGTLPSDSRPFSTRTVRERNWNAAWERSVGIVDATDRIVIKPSWKKLRKRDRGKIILQIDPKMSFGTGHHETTRLCLSMLQRHLSDGDRVLDIGTGTGILAIASAKLGAGRVVAVDHDPWSVQNARENVRRNRVQNKVAIRRQTISALPTGRFDLVLANIDLPTFRKSLRNITRQLKPGGHLITSGLLTSDLEPFTALLRRNRCVLLEIAAEGEWAAVVLTRDHAHRRP